VDVPLIMDKIVNLNGSELDGVCYQLFVLVARGIAVTLDFHCIQQTSSQVKQRPLLLQLIYGLESFRHRTFFFTASHLQKAFFVNFEDCGIQPLIFDITKLNPYCNLLHLNPTTPGISAD